MISRKRKEYKRYCELRDMRYTLSPGDLVYRVEAWHFDRRKWKIAVRKVIAAHPVNMDIAPLDENQEISRVAIFKYVGYRWWPTRELALEVAGMLHQEKLDSAKATMAYNYDVLRWIKRYKKRMAAK